MTDSAPQARTRSRNATVAGLLITLIIVGVTAVVLNGVATREQTWIREDLLNAGLVAYPEAKRVSGFVLETQKAAVSAQDLTGSWTLAFFGYTHCPDICPVTLAVMGRMQHLLEQSPPVDAVQMMFVSVDPDDELDAVQGYAEQFVSQARGATVAPASLLSLEHQIGVFSKVAGQQDSGAVLIDHSSTIYVFDPQGRLAAALVPDHGADSLTRAFLGFAQTRENS